MDWRPGDLQPSPRTVHVYLRPSSRPSLNRLPRRFARRVAPFISAWKYALFRLLFHQLRDHPHSVISRFSPPALTYSAPACWAVHHYSLHLLKALHFAAPQSEVQETDLNARHALDQTFWARGVTQARVGSTSWWSIIILHPGADMTLTAHLRTQRGCQVTISHWATAPQRWNY